MKRNSLHRKDSKKSLRFLHDAVAQKKKKKKEKTRKKRKNETGFRWTYSPTGRINWTGRASIIRCTNPDQEFASKSINLGRSLLYASVSSRRTTYVNQRSHFLRFHPLQYPDTVIFRLLPVRVTHHPSLPLYSSPSCVLSRVPSLCYRFFIRCAQFALSPSLIVSRQG